MSKIFRNDKQKRINTLNEEKISTLNEDRITTLNKKSLDYTICS